MGTNDPVIEAKIPLSDAMGLTENMTAAQVVERWSSWKSAYPAEVGTLSPAIVAALNALEVVVVVQAIILEVPPKVEAAVVAAGDAYNIAMSVLPGVGGAQGAKLALEKAMGFLKQALTQAMLKLRDLPITIYEQLTNTEVSEDAVL